MIKIVWRLFALLFFLSLFAAIIPFRYPVSALDEAQWTPVNIPTEGVAGKWTLANGSDIRHLTMANDGTLSTAMPIPPAPPIRSLNPLITAGAGQQQTRLVMLLLISPL